MVLPEGAIGPEDSVKDFQAETRDGAAGHVSWASYAPGESYLVVTVPHHLHRTHHVVPPSAVERVDTSGHKVWLHVAKEDVERAPDLPEPSTPVESPIMNVLRGRRRPGALERLGPDQHLAVQHDRPLPVRNRCAELCDRLVGPHLEHLDVGRDLVARPDRRAEGLVDVEEDAPRPRQVLGDDCVQQSGRHAALDDDAAEPAPSRARLVVVERVTVAGQLGEELDVPLAHDPGPPSALSNLDVHQGSVCSARTGRAGFPVLVLHGTPGSRLERWRRDGVPPSGD